MNLTASKVMSNLLVVGGGLTSAVTSALLTGHFAESSSADVVSVWDKARGAGGRMSTSRSSTNPECLADLGAQYITATPHGLREHKTFYDELTSEGLLSPLNSGIEGRKIIEPGSVDFVMPKGSSSIVKHFFNKSGVKVSFGQFVDSLTLANGKWSVTTKDGRSEVFECVILTMPVPQILQLCEQILETKVDIKNQLEAVKYSSRYGLALFYNEDKSLSLNLDGNVSAKYLDNDEIFRFVAIDNYKRRGKMEGPTSVVLHTSVPFGVEHVEKTTEEVEPLLLNHFQKLFPHWPKPDQVKCQKWRYSQVVSPFKNSPGCVVIHESPLLIAGGDGFVKSNFEGCLSSAINTVKVLKTFL